MLKLREAIETIYATTEPGDERNTRRRIAEEQARDAIAALPLLGRDAGELARSLRLNDACLAITGTYAGDVERYAAALATLDGDLARFVTQVREAAEAVEPLAALTESSAP